MITEISAQELKGLMDNKDDFIFIDCREQNEWDEAHIEGATLLPLSSFQENYQDFLADKNAKIVIQCKSGKRSMNACMFLLSQGYTNLINLEGGIIAWNEAGYPVKFRQA